VLWPIVVDGQLIGAMGVSAPTAKNASNAIDVVFKKQGASPQP